MKIEVQYKRCGEATYFKFVESICQYDLYVKTIHETSNNFLYYAIDYIHYAIAVGYIYNYAVKLIAAVLHNL